MSTPSIEECYRKVIKHFNDHIHDVLVKYEKTGQQTKDFVLPCGAGNTVSHLLTKPRYRLHEVHDFIPELFAVIKDNDNNGRMVAQVETREDADLVLKALNSYKP